MIGASFLGIFIIPPLYVMFQAVREKMKPPSHREVVAIKQPVKGI
jgi:hypothetical protein